MCFATNFCNSTLYLNSTYRSLILLHDNYLSNVFVLFDGDFGALVVIQLTISLLRTRSPLNLLLPHLILGWAFQHNIHKVVQFMSDALNQKRPAHNGSP